MSPWERFIVEPEAGGSRALLTLYHADCEPDPAVYGALRRMPRQHIPELLATGRHGGQAFDVVEFVSGGSLADANLSGALSAEAVRSLVAELGEALAEFAEAGLRHRDIRPKTVLLRQLDPLDVVVTGFGSARLSDYDLESVAPLKSSRYSAPESVIGAVSAASDWWSLGMIVLECATRGACFDGVNDQAFLLHVVTRGMELPNDLDPEVRVLLRGLLARDPLIRWSWPQVRAWLAGEPVEAPPEAASGPAQTGSPIVLAGREHRNPAAFALAAAEAANWTEARNLVLRGVLAHWLSENGADPQITAEVRRITSDDDLQEDHRLSLALMALNPDLPLVVAGEIVTPAWLLAHADDGYGLVTGPVARHLERMGREGWLVRLRVRAEAVRERARLLEIDLDEARLRVALLATSRANLEAERDRLRALFPDTEHNGLASIMERGRLSDEELIILVTASLSQFVPLAQLVDAAAELAARTGVSVQREDLPQLLSRPRREVFAAVDERTANFARCGVERVDEWADSFRIERRMPLPRAALVLAVAKERWREPPKQQYVANLLEHFEKRVAGSVARGPLVRFTIGKTTPRVDIMELGTPGRTGEALVSHVIERTDVQLTLDPSGYMSDEQVASRLRKLVNQASTFRRDTGIDGRFLGFPFFVTRDGRSGSGAGTPRVAPVLLWPVTLEMPPGWGQGAQIAFDREREEVRLNPALEGIVGSANFPRWKAARDELLAKGSLRVSDVMDVLSHLAPPRGRSIVRLPGKDTKVDPGVSEFLPAAALFNAEFTGQVVAEDLRQIRGKPLSGTVLEVALRLGEPVRPPAGQPSAERDRYLTVESDPSQDDAVERSRNAPGLVVEGPPGTGKSQTIVNIVANAIGHGETVLVVCQKQAALQVVKKRLEAEGLGERLFALRDINKDRTEVVTKLRSQVEAVLSPAAARATTSRRQREDRAARIETLERELDLHHEALQHIDDASGLSYRATLSELVGLEAAGPVVQAPRLRQIVGRLSGGELSALEEACGPLSRIWLTSGYEQSPLAALRLFAADEGTADLIRADLAAFRKAEQRRVDLAKRAEPGFETEEPEVIRAWLAREAAILDGLDDNSRQRLARWLDLFRTDGGTAATGDELLTKLQGIVGSLGALNAKSHDPAVFGMLAAKLDVDLGQIIVDLAAWAKRPGFFGKLSPARWRMRGRVRALAVELRVEAQDEPLARLRAAAELEQRLRPLRSQVASIREALRSDGLPDKLDLEGLRASAQQLLDDVLRARDAARAVLACPATELAAAAAKLPTREALAAFRERLEAACARYDARQTSLALLDPLAEWVEGAYLEAWRLRAKSGEDTSPIADRITVALARLRPYQQFRARAASLPDTALKLFAELRSVGAALWKVLPSELDGVVRRTIRREALLAVKARLESARPELLFERVELEAKVASLARLDAEMRELNKAVLSSDLDRGRLASATAWEDLTRLRGPRVRRLREIMDAGPDLGLMHLRPVWLMNPDVASRVLPLRPGLFDLVVYDEASQMPVEHAVPTLFRAKRAVISGDEKQMPPSSFFSSSVGSDEEEALDADELDEGATDAERIALEEGWNRREVKDCPDLLQLGRAALPVATLQIHYRSKYRELIGFSNAAFYGGTLSIPARHPADEIRRALPIEVIRVDGVYVNQTNPEEAERIVSLLEYYWSRPSDECPTIGVVTFNRKQADLIEDAVERRAVEDEEFAVALRRERDRLQDGEDMGFFVKNVENVQGDERDVVIFSTTFGRDSRGTFRRNFGVLGAVGGERRLNVAVTRAREKVVLVTSMPTRDVSDWLSSGHTPSKPRDYLQAYLDHAERVHACDEHAIRNSASRLGAKQPPKTSRTLEGDHDGLADAVAAYISELGHDPKSAHEAGDAFSIDFAVVDPRTGLFGIGIECDAPAHSLLARARAREIWRRGVLGRAIPVVHRISSRDWYHSPDEERARLRSALKQALG
ncbi:AAA domain-containing protein [Falsiroseomonas sp. HW251]|uniref:AAA domain-containing protein n=1 Tax=Falsiroseomonas sp. HW251 TaxID=3390998 RepID=UPI003D31D01E